MRGKTVLAAMAVAAAVAAAGSASAGEVTGIWQVPGSLITLRIGPCGAAVCGVLLNSPRIKADPNARDDKNKDASLRGRLLKGLTMLQGFKGGPTAWTGNVYLPGNGQTYRATMTFGDADTLRLKVCPAGPLCRTQVLKRVD